MVVKGDLWSVEEFNFLRFNWEKMSTRDLALELGRPLDSVRQQARSIGLFREVRLCSMVQRDRDAAYMCKVREEVFSDE